MGKSGINLKAQEGRERKAQRELEKKHQLELKKKAIEDLKWQEGTKDTSRRDDLLHKKQEKLEKKRLREEILAKEDKELSAAYAKPLMRVPKDKESQTKEDQFSRLLSRQKNLAQEAVSSADVGTPEKSVESQVPLHSVDLEPAKTTSQPVFSASTVEDALFLLEAPETPGVATGSAVSPTIERHPERRVKAAYKAYEEQELPKLKEENPFLKLSQLKELLAKNWKKSPLNPFNQEYVQYDASKREVKQHAVSQAERKLEKLKM